MLPPLDVTAAASSVAASAAEVSAAESSDDVSAVSSVAVSVLVVVAAVSLLPQPTSKEATIVMLKRALKTFFFISYPPF
jgi:hypothetical protein